MMNNLTQKNKVINASTTRVETELKNKIEKIEENKKKFASTLKQNPMFLSKTQSKKLLSHQKAIDQLNTQARQNARRVKTCFSQDQYNECVKIAKEHWKEFDNFDKPQGNFMSVNIKSDLSGSIAGLVKKFEGAHDQITKALTKGIDDTVAGATTVMSMMAKVACVVLVAAGAAYVAYKLQHNRLLSSTMVAALMYFAATIEDPSFKNQLLGYLSSIKKFIQNVCFGECASAVSEASKVDGFTKIPMSDLATFEDGEIDKPQAIEVPFGETTLTFVISVIGSFLSFDQNNKLKTTQYFKNFGINWVYLQRSSESIMSIFNYLMDRVLDIFNYVKTKLIGGDKYVRAKTKIAEVDDWCEKTENICTKVYKGLCPIDVETGDQLWSYKMQGLRMNSVSYGSVKMDSLVRTCIQSHLHQLNKTLEPYEHLNIVGGGPRVEPVGILISGDTGIGKSLFCYRFLLELAVKILPKSELNSLLQNWSHFFYVRQAENKYWDGYHGQFFTIFDDFGSARDVAGQPENEYFDFLRCLNAFPHHCHMADIGSKGSVLFKSKIVLGTTNLNQIRPNSMTNPEAVDRRPMRFRMILKDEYSSEWFSYNGCVGKKKLNPDILKLSDGYNTDWHLLEPIDSSGSATGPKMSFSEFVSYIIGVFNEKQMIGDKYLKNLNEIAANLAANRVKDFVSTPQSAEVVKVMKLEKVIDLIDSDFDAQIRILDSGISHADTELNVELNLLNQHLVDMWAHGKVSTLCEDDALSRVHKENNGVTGMLDNDWLEFRNDFFSVLGLQDSEIALFSVGSSIKYTDLRIFSWDDIDSQLRKVVSIKLHKKQVCEWMNPVYCLYLLCITFEKFEEIFMEELHDKESNFTRTKYMINNSDLVNFLPDIMHKHIRRLYLNDKRSLSFCRKNLDLVRAKIQSAWNCVRTEHSGLFYFVKIASVTFAVYTGVSLLAGLVNDKDNNPSIISNVPIVTNFGYKSLFKDANLQDFVEKHQLKIYRVTDIGGTGRIETRMWLQPSAVNLLSSKYHCEEYFGNEPISSLNQGITDSLYKQQINVYDHGSPNSSRKMKAKTLIRRDMKAAEYKPQMLDVPQQADDEVAWLLSQKIIKSNTYCIYKYRTDQNNAFLGSLVFICDRIAMIPLHYVQRFKKAIDDGMVNSTIMMEEYGGVVAHELTYNDIVSHSVTTPNLSKSDVCLLDFRFLKKLRAHKNVLAQFISKDAPILNTKNITISIGLCRDGAPLFTSCEAVVVREHPVNDETGMYTLTIGLRYPINTTDGDCGNLILCNNKFNNQGKILGMHVAGSSIKRCGTASVVCRQDLKEAIKMINEDNIDNSELKLNYLNSDISGILKCLYTPQNADAFDIDDSGFDIIGELEYPIVSATRTKIKPSRMSSYLEPPIKAIAHLHPMMIDGVLLDPLGKAVKKYLEPKPNLTDDTILSFAAATMELGAWIFRMSPHKKQLDKLTIEQAVLGIPDIEYCSSIPRTTSAGYPYAQINRGDTSGKTLWFGDGENYDLENHHFDKIRQDVIELIEDYSSGRDTNCCFTVAAKDETRSLEKVGRYETRAVFGSPLHMTICHRMYFVGFQQWIMRNQIYNSLALGINVFSTAWDQLARSLQSKGLKVVAGDFKGLDRSMYSSFILMIVKMIINPFYDGDSDDDLRVAMAKDSSQAKIAFREWCIKVNDILPSGCIFTSLMDSLYILVSLRACFSDLCPEGMSFDDHIYAIAYGDDNVLNVSDQAIEYFNQNTLPGAMVKYNLIYTAEDKECEVVPDWRPISEVSFLKRYFRYSPLVDRFISPLELDTIINMLYWTKKGLMSEEIELENIETALLELSQHSIEVWDQYSYEICHASRNYIDYFPIHIHRQATLMELVNVNQEQWL